MLSICECKSLNSQLVSLGYWPSTPISPEVAIDMRLMELLTSFTFKAHDSVTAFCSAMAYFNRDYSSTLPTKPVSDSEVQLIMLN